MRLHLLCCRQPSGSGPYRSLCRTSSSLVVVGRVDRSLRRTSSSSLVVVGGLVEPSQRGTSSSLVGDGGALLAPRIILARLRRLEDGDLAEPSAVRAPRLLLPRWPSGALAAAHLLLARLWRWSSTSASPRPSSSAEARGRRPHLLLSCLRSRPCAAVPPRGCPPMAASACERMSGQQ
jgi:hypothetical protein